MRDNITVTTKMVYDNGVRADANYPRFVSSPRNALEIQRRNGATNDSKVTTTIKFNTPVIPTFNISGLDLRSGQKDKVIITAKCTGGVAIPILRYGGGDKPTYKIQGNTATVDKAKSVSATDRNGTLNVSFQNGVEEIVIEYLTIRSSNSSGAQSIFISPVTISSAQNAPVVNEDGMALTKWAQPSDITTCESVEYTFNIKNANVRNKYVHLTDVLPDGMKWVDGSISLDIINAEQNPSIKFNNFGGTNRLNIDSLLVPCTNNITLTATAVPDRNIASGIYSNRAEITYERTVNNVSFSETWKSYNRDGDSLTTVNITWEERKDTVVLNATLSPAIYAANKEVLVTLEVSNPNSEDITDMFLDLDWDAGFKYVAGSWNGAAGSKPSGAGSSTTLAIAGATAGSGFTLPQGVTVFTFKLLAPDAANLEHELDANGQPKKQIVPLNIFYEFSSEMSNPCIVESLNDLSGVLQMPYGAKTHIIVNKHVTTNTIK